MDTAIKRAAPLTGVTFALLYLAAMFLYRKGQPEFAADSGEITEYFAAQSAYVSLGSLAVFVSAPFWFIFIGCVYSSSFLSDDEAMAELAARVADEAGLELTRLRTAAHGIGELSCQGQKQHDRSAHATASRCRRRQRGRRHAPFAPRARVIAMDTTVADFDNDGTFEVTTPDGTTQQSRPPDDPELRRLFEP